MKSIQSDVDPWDTPIQSRGILKRPRLDPSFGSRQRAWWMTNKIFITRGRIIFQSSAGCQGRNAVQISIKVRFSLILCECAGCAQKAQHLDPFFLPASNTLCLAASICNRIGEVKHSCSALEEMAASYFVKGGTIGVLNLCGFRVRAPPKSPPPSPPARGRSRVCASLKHSLQRG